MDNGGNPATWRSVIPNMREFRLVVVAGVAGVLIAAAILLVPAPSQPQMVRIADSQAAVTGP
jgi:hypothetical protein